MESWHDYGMIMGLLWNYIIWDDYWIMWDCPPAIQHGWNALNGALVCEVINELHGGSSNEQALTGGYWDS